MFCYLTLLEVKTYSLTIVTAHKRTRENKVYRVALIQHVSSIKTYRLNGSNQVTSFETLLCSVDEE